MRGDRGQAGYPGDQVSEFIFHNHMATDDVYRDQEEKLAILEHLVHQD